MQHPLKPVVVTASLIEKNGKILLVQEGHEFAYGLWNFPAGKLEEKISLIKNAEKEVEEETGYKSKVKGLVGVYHKARKDANVVRIIFASSITGGKIRTNPDDEIIQAKWMTHKEIKKLGKQLRSEDILMAIKDYKKRGSLPIGLIKSFSS
jgi:ADP-ribose pyrophosphatase YjhB (NUDIX family)